MIFIMIITLPQLHVTRNDLNTFLLLILTQLFVEFVTENSSIFAHYGLLFYS